MRTKQIAEEPKTYAVILETGEEVLSSLRAFAREHHLTASSFQAIGAFSSVELAWFNWRTKRYQSSVRLDEQVELLSLLGDVAVKEGEPQVHAHVVIGLADGTTRGGHLMRASVRPTCEVILPESPRHLEKEIDPESGLALIRV